MSRQGAKASMRLPGSGKNLKPGGAAGGGLRVRNGLPDAPLSPTVKPDPTDHRASSWHGAQVGTAEGFDRIDAAVDEMRAFLNKVNPVTDAEALQTLRIAFPGVPLGERIAAIRDRFFA